MLNFLRFELRNLWTSFGDCLRKIGVKDVFETNNLNLLKTSSACSLQNSISIYSKFFSQPSLNFPLTESDTKIQKFHSTNKYFENFWENTQQKKLFFIWNEIVIQNFYICMKSRFGGRKIINWAYIFCRRRTFEESRRVFL